MPILLDFYISGCQYGHPTFSAFLIHWLARKRSLFTSSINQHILMEDLSHQPADTKYKGYLQWWIQEATLVSMVTHFTQTNKPYIVWVIQSYSYDSVLIMGHFK